MSSSLPYPSANGASPPPPRARRILVVDDDPGLNRLVRAILRSAGFDVTTAADGRQALAIALAQHFDAVVLDLLMPELDGRGFFREFRAAGETSPVLIVSAYGAHDAQRELGAEGSITKPFDPEVLLHTLDNLLVPTETT